MRNLYPQQRPVVRCDWKITMPRSGDRLDLRRQRIELSVYCLQIVVFRHTYYDRTPSQAGQRHVACNLLRMMARDRLHFYCHSQATLCLLNIPSLFIIFALLCMHTRKKYYRECMSWCVGVGVNLVAGHSLSRAAPTSTEQTAKDYEYCCCKCVK